MNDKYLLILTLPMILNTSNSSFAAESYTEPPQLYKEIDLRQQSEARMAREQAARLAEEQRIIKEQEARAEREKQIAKQKEKEQALRDAKEKKINEQKQREKIAREKEEKRVAQEKSAHEQETKRLDEEIREIRRERLIVTEQPYAGSAGVDNSDMAVARKFVAELPPACSSSRIYNSADGTVNIRIICFAPGNSMDGLISIKDGVLTHIR